MELVGSEAATSSLENQSPCKPRNLRGWVMWPHQPPADIPQSRGLVLSAFSDAENGQERDLTIPAAVDSPQSALTSLYIISHSIVRFFNSIIIIILFLFLLFQYRSPASFLTIVINQQFQLYPQMDEEIRILGAIHATGIEQNRHHTSRLSNIKITEDQLNSISNTHHHHRQNYQCLTSLSGFHRHVIHHMNLGLYLGPESRIPDPLPNT